MSSLCSSASCTAAGPNSACFGPPAPRFCSTLCCFWDSSWPPSPWASTSKCSKARTSSSTHPKLSECFFFFCWSKIVLLLGSQLKVLRHVKKWSNCFQRDRRVCEESPYCSPDHHSLPVLGGLCSAAHPRRDVSV